MRPANSWGLTPGVAEYRKNRMGVQSGFHDALQIVGETCCPGTPTPHEDASKDHLSALIETPAHHPRIKSRIPAAPE
ncbi:hypothetical protein CLE01_19090 [Cryobacterium levicorallinum]|nr:hypothetical protein CLE01_19090 [Cryobacterium levicorallinum]